jgi:hypothetical protein
MQGNSPSRRFGDDLDREVVPWQPAKADKLIGKVLTLEWVDSRFSDEQYPYLEVDSVDGQLISWHAAQTVAKGAIRRKNVRVGDQLAVKYLGEVGDPTYKDFRILAEHADGQAQTETFVDNGAPIGEPPDDLAG